LPVSVRKRCETKITYFIKSANDHLLSRARALPREFDFGNRDKHIRPAFQSRFQKRLLSGGYRIIADGSLTNLVGAYYRYCSIDLNGWSPGIRAKCAERRRDHDIAPRGLKSTANGLKSARH
jgi:hypothetical protein